MPANRKIRVAIVGLGFGAEFIPIYQAHPQAEMYALCRRTRAELDRCGNRFGIPVRYTDFNDVLKDPKVDAVHINSPIPDHACTKPGRSQGRQTRRLHRTDGHHGQRVPGRSSRPSVQSGKSLHDDGDGGLQSRIPVRQGAV